VTTGKHHWPVRLAAAAQDDFQEILRWTAEQFGEEQARIYAQALSAALEEPSTGPKPIGALARSDIAKGLFTLHVARHGRRGRHLVMFRIGHDQRGDVIEVLRLLHDAMDLLRHLPLMDETN